MVTEERGRSKRFAKNSMQASLARPSTGGAVNASFSASPTAPVMEFFLARGCTLTAKAAPAEVSRIGIMTFDFTTESQSHRESLHTNPDGISSARIRFSFFLCLCDSVVDHLLNLPPKIAVPMRTQVDPSSIATSKSCVIPIESSPILAAGNLRVIRSRKSRSFRK